jgi:hypothetical protein
MKRHTFLRSIRCVLAVALSVLAVGCASRPAAVPVEGAPADLSALAGDSATGSWLDRFTFEFHRIPEAR